MNTEIGSRGNKGLIGVGSRCYTQVFALFAKIVREILSSRQLNDAHLEILLGFEIKMLQPSTSIAFDPTARQMAEQDITQPPGLVILRDIFDYDFEAVRLDKTRWKRVDTDDTRAQTNR